MAAPVPEMPPEMIASFQYQKEHIHEDRRAELIGVTWFLWTLAAVATGLRFYAERMLRNRFGYHDALILLGLFFTTGLCVNLTVGAIVLGSGRHLILLDEAAIAGVAKLLFAFEYIYFFANFTIKASILVFYWRTFPNHPFRIAVWCVAAFISAYQVAMIIVTTFQCTPISSVWNKKQPGDCVNTTTLFVSAAIINVITDFIIVIMPLPLIWRLKMPRGRKIGLCGIFALSSVVIIASIVRPITLQNLGTYDITYDGIPIGHWTIVEVSLGIVGACLPLMTPLFRKFKEVSTKDRSGGSGSGGVGGAIWNHTRLQEGRTAKSATQTRRKPSEGLRSGEPVVPLYLAPDGSPSTSQREWADRDFDNDLTEQVKRDLEMQDLPKPFYQ